MQLGEVMQRLRTYIQERYCIPLGDTEFTEDVHLFDYGYVDSFGAVDLISFVETSFGTPVTQSDLILYPLNTIREIATFVVNRTEGASHVDSSR